MGPTLWNARGLLTRLLPPHRWWPWCQGTNVTVSPAGQTEPFKSVFQRFLVCSLLHILHFHPVLKLCPVSPKKPWPHSAAGLPVLDTSFKKGQAVPSVSAALADHASGPLRAHPRGLRVHALLLSLHHGTGRVAFLVACPETPVAVWPL